MTQRVANTSGKWVFPNRFRRAGFSWRASRLACQRISEALAELSAAAKHNPVHAAEGAVRFLEKISPALEQVDSSSGALGGAVNHAIAVLVPIISSAPVTAAERERWLDRLFEAYQDDEIPYIESLGEQWGELCGSAELASRWADRLMSLVAHVNADRRAGRHSYSKSTAVVHSALFAAGRYDELKALVLQDPRPMWHDLQWIGRIEIARGNVDGAIAFMDRAVGKWTPRVGLAHFAEKALLAAGRSREAYERYAIEANQRTSYLGTYRAIAAKYPDVDPDRLLADLIASTPEEEGKWFATAKTLKRFDLAMSLAWRSPCDPKTLARAARDFSEKQPVFAAEVALAALHWICLDYGYELTSHDVIAPYRLAIELGQRLDQSDKVTLRLQTMLARDSVRVRWVRQMLSSP
jgi:hypothetical protein